MSVVFVVDSQGTPLLPTHPARARKILREGRAKVEQVVPFTIRLNRKVENPVGSFEVGVDDGSKHVGIAVKNTNTEEIVFRGQLDHRQDVSRKVEERRNYRKARRHRLRNRKPRFNNRTSCKIAPSIRQRKEAILRLITDLGKRLKIVKVKVEEIFFNHFKYDWGKYFSLVEIGKNFLKNQFIKMGFVYETTYGYDAKSSRINLGLSKGHSNDACAIVESNKIKDREWFIKPRRTRVWLNNPTKKCDEKNGFRHYDLIVSLNRNLGKIIGSVRSLKEKAMTIRTKFNENFAVSYKKSRLLQRFRGLIYSYI